MKTVDEKALEIVRNWRSGAYHTETQANAALQVAIIEALKTQDRDTRHACAEAVIQLPACHTANDNAIYTAEGGITCAVERSAAHAACINVKAV